LVKAIINGIHNPAAYLSPPPQNPHPPCPVGRQSVVSLPGERLAWDLQLLHMEADRMGTITPKPTLPETGFVRLPSIIGDAKADPPIPAIIPVSRSTWLEGVKSGQLPATGKARTQGDRLASE
jgi:hypothetical protein